MLYYDCMINVCYFEEVTRKVDYTSLKRFHKVDYTCWIDFPALVYTVPFSLVQALCIIRQHNRKTVPSKEDNNVIVVIWAGFRSFVFTSVSKYTYIALHLITGGLYVWCCSKLAVYSYVPLSFCNPPLCYIVPVTSAAGNANPSGAHEFIPDF
jgi:hypothetical protein